MGSAAAARGMCLRDSQIGVFGRVRTPGLLPGPPVLRVGPVRIREGGKDGEGL